MNPQISTYEPAQPAESLFDLLGGRAAIAAVVERLYKHILNDEELRPYFARSDMTRLKSQQVDFFTALTGGPAQYRGAPLKQAHSHVPVSGAQFDRLAGHLATAMRELGVSQALIDATLAALAPARRAVVNTSEAPSAESAPTPRLSRPPAEPRTSRPPATIEAPGAAAQGATTATAAASASAAATASAAPAAAPSPPPAPATAVAAAPAATAAPTTSTPTHPPMVANAANDDPLSDLRFLRAALDNMPTPVLLADAGRQVIYANDRALRAVDQLGEGFRAAIGASAGLGGASIAAFCGDAGAAAQAFAAPSLPWEMRVTVGGSPLQVRVNGVFDSGNALRGYIVQWEAVSEPAEEPAAEPAPRATAPEVSTTGAERPVVTPVPGGTHVTLTVNGSTMTLVLGEGELNVQYVPPAQPGAAPRAVGLRIGPPST